MRHQNGVFHDLVKRVPWGDFERLVAEHNADKHVRRLPTKSQFIALLYGQLSGAVSLREIVGGLESHTARLYHVGAKPVSRSTLADANAQRPCAVFGELFAVMVARAQRGLPPIRTARRLGITSAGCSMSRGAIGRPVRQLCGRWNWILIGRMRSAIWSAAGCWRNWRGRSGEARTSA